MRKKNHSLHKALIASQQMTEEIKEQALNEAMLIIEAAQIKADRIANQTNLRLAQIKDVMSRVQTISQSI